MKPIDKYKISSLIIIIIIINGVLIFNIFKTINNISGKVEDIAYISQIKDNVNYSVYINDNPYIESNVLFDNYSYVTSLIDFIKFDFDYEYQVDRDIQLNYSYLIKGTIIGLYPGDGLERVMKPIWNKEYILLKETDKQEGKSIKINETIDLTLDSYNDLVNNFIDDYNILLNSNLEIKLIIKINGVVNNMEINNEHNIISSIPLGVKAFDITTSKNFLETETIYLKPQPSKETSYMKIIIYIVINIILIGCGYYFIKKIIDKYRSEYLLKINKILKEYDDRLVEVTNFIKYESWETVDVITFEELLDLSNEAFEPIFFWERKIHRNREAWFCILREKVLYRYILHKNEFKKAD